MSRQRAEREICHSLSSLLIKSEGKERKKENRQPKGGMGGRHAATTQKERKKQDIETQTRDGGGGQGPHLHEQDFGRTIRGTGGALLLLTHDRLAARCA